jgi:hypothetical protein
MLPWVPPPLISGALLVLILAQLSYAFWPHRPRRFLSILALTLVGVLLGQLWSVLGLPGLRLGEVNLLPAVAFVTALQPFAGRLILRLP